MLSQEGRVIFLALICLAFSSIVPISAATFLRSRETRKKMQLEGLLGRLPVDNNLELRMRTHFEQQQVAKDFYLPVSLCTFAVLLSSYNIFLGGETFVYDGYNLLLGGMSLIEYQPQLNSFEIARWRSLLALGMAFLGGYIWTFQSISRRLIEADLSPATYYGAAIRLILSQFAALVLSLTISASPGSTHTTQYLPVLAFVAGMYPDRSVRALRRRFNSFLRSEGESAQELPLDMIEGMSSFHKNRLEEIGIDNGQNLAEADVLDLALRTPFPPALLVDWIGQAKIYAYFKSNIQHLRSLGIRTVFDLLSAGSAGQLKAISKELSELSGTQGTELCLQLVYSRMSQDSSVGNLRTLYEVLGGVEIAASEA